MNECSPERETPLRQPEGQSDATADAAIDAGPERSLRTRMTAQERRDSILVAARREFARSGFHGASTARIATAAGCSEPMLYKHFAGKQELFAAVLEQVSMTMEAQIDAILGAPGDPLENWSNALSTIMQNPLYAEMVGLRKLAVTLADDPLICASLQGGTDRLRARVKAALDICRANGTIRHDVDSDYVAWMWLGLTLVGAYRQAIEDEGGFARMERHAQAFIASLRP